MAIYRKINTTFWSDPFICDLDPDKKLFYLYLLTNERTKQCGIYDISKRQISFDLSIDLKIVTENINFFTKNNKIMFSENTNEIAIRNWNRFNGSTSPKVVTCVESELKLVKNRVLIEYIYGKYTLSQETQAPVPAETQAPVPKKDTIDERKLKFASTLEPFLITYGKELLNDFYKYWTEPNKSNTKFKQELERTWSLERRLETWAKNDKNFNSKQNGKSTEKPVIGRATAETIANNLKGWDQCQ